jgi:hypothetical protein
MAKLTAGILGAIAVSLTFGAVQFALGRDLSEAGHPPSGVEATAVNRAAKADRAVAAAASRVPTQTISIYLDGVADRSVLVRIPVAVAVRNGAPAPSAPKSGASTTVACEPVVSILTEVAKRLPPGRCVT